MARASNRRGGRKEQERTPKATTGPASNRRGGHEPKSRSDPRKGLTEAGSAAGDPERNSSREDPTPESRREPAEQWVPGRTERAEAHGAATDAEESAPPNASDLRTIPTGGDTLRTQSCRSGK